MGKIIHLILSLPKIFRLIKDMYYSIKDWVHMRKVKKVNKKKVEEFKNGDKEDRTDNFSNLP